MSRIDSWSQLLAEKQKMQKTLGIVRAEVESQTRCSSADYLSSYQKRKTLKNLLGVK